MTWLVAHMWIALAAAAFVALLLGWSLRGMMLLGKLRKAEVDRDVARVELGEARDEIERLFAAQRKLLTGQGGTQMAEAVLASPQADPELERQLAETVAALHSARAELEELKAAPPVLAPAPEMAAMPMVDPAVSARAAELEQRVGGLEAELQAARAALEAAEVAKAEAVAAAVAAAPAVAEPEPAPAAEPDPKLVWKVNYLTQRVTALEDEVASQPVAPAVVASVPEAPVEVAAPEPEAPAKSADTESIEEELASLRWRNRYLEGRLAYFEGDAAAVADEIAADDEGEAALEDDEDAYEEDEASEDDAYAEDDDGEDFEEYEDDADDEDEDYPSAAETILGRLEEDDAAAEDAEPVVPARPLALEKPVEGAPDDLTLIGGIGPRIQEVLNSIGVFHYDQIAEWSRENIAWVDDYLNFNGRIRREGWVEQAAILVDESVGS
ncbi:hypothetical protein K1X12_07300 [Hyphomonas sp. WL0036]|uniref:hypothetical protein n=1 Tax=Hyphomonas sediminis TaxID=2866160 RepID=UPI001C826151|nr:hypothetical protein [Hyphomonas sediminis]MBY9066700.1 hypothetical protein [Hyphomonas sediminis]